MASARMSGCMEHMALQKYNPFYSFSRNQLFLGGKNLTKSANVEDRMKEECWRRNEGGWLQDFALSRKNVFSICLKGLMGMRYFFATAQPQTPKPLS